MSLVPSPASLEVSDLYLGSMQVSASISLDTTSLHKAVMSVFPQATNKQRAREEIGVLFRVVEGPKQDAVRLLLLSTIDAVNPQAPMKNIAHPTFEEGDTVTFTLDANITKRIPASRNEGRASHNGRLVAINSVADMRTWLDHKGELHGFRVLQASFAPAPLHLRMGEGGIFIVATRIRTEVEVVDADLFLQAVVHGIGRGRAYGCGLVDVFETV